MVLFAKGTTLLLIATFAVCLATECSNPPPCEEDDAIPPYVPRPKAPPHNLKVAQTAGTIQPIHYEADDYCGPYDPMDPTGVGAARRRELKIKGKEFIDEAKTYYPKGLGNFVKKEAIKFAINEGKKFACQHPKETGTILDIVGKVKKLYTQGMDEVKKYENAKEGGCDKKPGLKLGC